MADLDRQRGCEVRGTLIGARNPLLYGLRAYAAWSAGQLRQPKLNVGRALSFDMWLQS